MYGVVSDRENRDWGTDAKGGKERLFRYMSCGFCRVREGGGWAKFL